MTKHREPVRVVATPEYKLPASFNREIGRIIVSWAYFENSVRRGIWEILGVDERMGRIAARDPRIDDRLEMLLDLAFLREIKINEEAVKLLIARSKEVLSWRDLLAHGVWVPTPDGWLIQMTAGSYPKDAL